MAERILVTIEVELFKEDSRGVFPDADDLDGWVLVLADWIDNMDGVPVCTDPDHTCNQHISQMEDTEWRIASITSVTK